MPDPGFRIALDGQSSAATTDVYHCEGCGGAIPYAGRGRHPKWCSGRCRKRSYGDPCVECGAKTRYGAESARVPVPHCDDCRKRLDSDRRCELVMQMVELRANGLTNKQIGDRMGKSNLSVATELCRMRSLGFDIPAADYKNAKLGDLPPKMLEEARVLGRELALRGIHVPALEEVAA